MEKKLTQNKVFRTIRNWLILAAALTAAWVLCSSLSTVGTSDTFVPMIFILAVLIVSLTTDGYFYGIVTSLASVIGVNYAFTFPYMKLNFSIYGYPVTFVTMLAVSLVISTLTTRAREQEKLRHEAAQAKLRADPASRDITRFADTADLNNRLDRHCAQRGRSPFVGRAQRSAQRCQAGCRMACANG